MLADVFPWSAARAGILTAAERGEADCHPAEAGTHEFERIASSHSALSGMDPVGI